MMNSSFESKKALWTIAASSVIKFVESDFMPKQIASIIFILQFVLVINGTVRVDGKRFKKWMVHHFYGILRTYEICSFFKKITVMNVSTKQSYLAIQCHPWHVVKMITIFQTRMTKYSKYYQQTVLWRRTCHCHNENLCNLQICLLHTVHCMRSRLHTFT